jgi:hypothetical protein
MASISFGYRSPTEGGLQLEQLVLRVQGPQHGDRGFGELEPGEVAVGPRHEEPADLFPLVLISALDSRIGGLLVDRDHPVVRVEAHSHPLGAILHRVRAVVKHDQGLVEDLPHEAAVAAAAAHVGGVDRLPLGVLPTSWVCSFGLRNGCSLSSSSDSIRSAL